MLENLGKTTTDGPCLLGSEIKRKMLLALVKLLEVFTSLRLDDSQDTGDGFSDRITVKDSQGRRILVICRVRLRWVCGAALVK